MDDEGLRPEKCPSCGAPPEQLGVMEEFENKAVYISPPGITFDHARRRFQCGACGHEWTMDRVRYEQAAGPSSAD